MRAGFHPGAGDVVGNSAFGDPKGRSELWGAPAAGATRAVDAGAGVELGGEDHRPDAVVGENAGVVTRDADDRAFETEAAQVIGVRL